MFDLLGNYENLVKPLLSFFEENKIICIIILFFLAAIIFFILRRKDLEFMTTKTLENQELEEESDDEILK